mgnify:CR=1 FL=1
MENIKSGLYIVSTPIGNLNDISIRAVEALKNADLVICENPKHSIKILSKLGIKKKLISLHDYNEINVIKRVEKHIKNQIIVLISDAGSPLVSDPGYKLVKYFIENKAYVTSIPGPTSIISALQLSTLPMNQFIFLGFAPKTKKQLQEFLKQILDLKQTSVFFISSHRISICMEEMNFILKNKKIAVCKELTKLNEKIFIGLPKKVLADIENEPKNKLGEFVVVVEGVRKTSKLNNFINIEIENQINKLLEKFSLTDVVEIVHKISYIGKKEIYKKALKLKK